MRVRLTPRGIALVVAAVAVLGAAEVLGHAVLRVVSAAAVAVLLAGLLMCVYRVRVRVERVILPDRVERGTPAAASLTISNDRARTSSGFLATDPPSTAPVAVARLAPGRSRIYTYALPSDRRGRIEVGPLTLYRVDLLGLVSAHTTQGERSVLWVHPKIHRALVRPGARPRHHHEGVFGEPPLRGSVDVRSVREYVAGDEPRRIHWRATARAGQLMVRDYVDPAQPRFTVVLDCDPSALDDDEFEAAVEVAASLAVSACDSGCRTRLVTNTTTDLVVEPGPVGRGRLLDRLCEVARSQDTTALPDVLLRVRDPGAGLVLLTGTTAVTDPSVSAALVSDAAHVTVFDLSAAPSNTGQPMVPTIGEPDPARAVAAWNAGGSL